MESTDDASIMSTSFFTKRKSIMLPPRSRQSRHNGAFFAARQSGVSCDLQ